MMTAILIVIFYLGTACGVMGAMLMRTSSSGGDQRTDTREDLVPGSDRFRRAA